MSQLLNQKQQVLLNDFDRIMGVYFLLRKDYRDHQNELYLKLVSIMADRLNVHAANIMVILTNCRT
jgi:Vps54-like protein